MNKRKLIKPEVAALKSTFRCCSFGREPEGIGAFKWSAWKKLTVNFSHHVRWGAARHREGFPGPRRGSHRHKHAHTHTRQAHKYFL